jgi:hypothetical protein
MRLLRTLILVLVGMTTTQSLAEEIGLTGTIRNTFVESAFRTCFQRQTAEGVNKGLDTATIAQYCVCFVDRMADQVTTDDVSAIESSASNRSLVESKMQSIAKLAGEACRAKSQK